ncbi:retrovirus-related pol polyprotein from transposon TNT 1-94 [Tanacetum coccineum]
MFDEYFEQSTDSEPVPAATVLNAPIVSTNTSVSTMIAQDAPSTSHSLSSSQVHPPVFPQGVAAGPTIEDTSITQAGLHPSVNPVAGEPDSAQSTLGYVSLAEPNQVTQPPDHLRKWSKDHPLDNIVVEPKNFKMVVTKDSWFEAMQNEILEFDRLEVWILVPKPKGLMIIALKWIYKVKLDEYGDVLKNKARLVAKGYRQEEGSKGMLMQMRIMRDVKIQEEVRRSSKEAKEPNLQISVDTLHNTNFFRALTASADVPSSVTETTSTLQPPPPPPLQIPIVHRDICYKDGKVRSKCENKGIVPTEMELVLEYTQQGASHEVSSIRVIRSYERSHKGVKASANSDIVYFFTSAQDGNTLQDDERLDLVDDLMKSQVHNQRQVNDDLKKAHDHNQNKSK